MSGTKPFYFGNLAKARYVPAPDSGMEANHVGQSEQVDYFNGGAFVATGSGTHREFNMTWGVQEKSAMDFLQEYRSGVNGTGLLYFVDPFAANAMPPYWARPELTCDGGPSLLDPYTQPTKVAGATVTNLVTNPSFEAAGSAVTVRENLALNPNGVGATGFSNNNGAQHTLTRAAVVNTNPQGITTAVKSLRAAAGASTPLIMSIYNIDSLVNTGPARNIGAWFWVSAPGYSAGFSGGALVPLTATTWTWLTAPVVANVYVSAYVQRTDAAAANFTDHAYITGITALATEVPTEAIWGDRPAAGDFTYAWSGAVDSSSSYQRGATVAGLGDYLGATGIQSTSWKSSGAKSLRIISSKTGGSSNSAVSLPLATLGAGQTYTILAKMRMIAPQVAPYSISRRLRIIGGTTKLGPQMLNVAGDQFYQWQFVADGSETVLQLWNGTPPGDSDVWWDDLLLVAGEYSGPYFDGSSHFVNGANGAWTGAADASTSTIPLTATNLPNFAAEYSIRTEPNYMPTRMCVLLIPDDRDLWLGFTGTATNGGVVRIQPVTRDGAYGAPVDATLLSPNGSTRLNQKFSGATYDAVRIYLTSTLDGTSTVRLVSSKAIYTDLGVTPTVTGGHVEGEGHTGLRFKEGSVNMTYIQAADGHRYVTTAATFTEVGAWA